jgi:hypothetical protein
MDWRVWYTRERKRLAILVSRFLARGAVASRGSRTGAQDRTVAFR